MKQGQRWQGDEPGPELGDSAQSRDEATLGDKTAETHCNARSVLAVSPGSGDGLTSSLTVSDPIRPQEALRARRSKEVARK